MFFQKKREVRTYDRENFRPVVRSSICTGEKAAGFQDVHTGKATGGMLLRPPGHLEEVRRLYGTGPGEISRIY